MASLRDTLANLVEQYKASDTPLANLMRGDKEGAKQAVANALQQATQDPYSGLNVLGTTKLVGKTAQELAHEVAQKNAVEMLGLHPENTAMERAKALGFDIENPAYHGTRHKFNEFAVSQPRGAMGNEPGVYFAKDKSHAEEFALNGDYPDEKSRVITAFLRNPKVKKSYAGTEYIVNNPANIRDINAAFDPARVNEPDLLAGAMALPIATDKDKRNKIIDLLKNK